MIKKIICIILLFVISPIPVFSMETGKIEYTNSMYVFKSGDSEKLAHNAASVMLLYQNSKNLQDKNFYRQMAMRYYFLLTKCSPSSIDGYLGLARIYDDMNLDSLAQKGFFDALSIDTNNPKVNFYFANYYYKRLDFMKALVYTKSAYKNGYNNNYLVNYRLGQIYEKLADIETAKEFYNNALQLCGNNSELIDKIHLLDELNYSESQYYLFDK